MSSQPDRFFVYRTRDGAASLPHGSTEWGVIRSLDARHGRRRLGLKAVRRGDSLGPTIRSGVLPLLLSNSASKTPARRQVIYPRIDNGEVFETKASDFLKAAKSLLAEMDSLGEDIAVEYGALMNLRAPALQFVPPHRYKTDVSRGEIETHIASAWCRYYTGVLFPDDPHCCSLWSAYGMLDLIKHAPVTLREIERIDLRAHAGRLHPVNGGHIDLFSRPHDLSPFISGLNRLCSLLENTSDQTVKIMAVPGEKQRRGYIDAGLSLDHYWPIPKD